MNATKSNAVVNYAVKMSEHFKIIIFNDTKKEISLFLKSQDLFFFNSIIFSKHYTESLNDTVYIYTYT